MTLLPSISINLTHEHVTACMEGPLDSPRLSAEVDKAIDRARELIQAAAVWEWASLVDMGLGSITVSRDSKIGKKTIITLETGTQSQEIWGHAKKVLVYVVTIGPLVDLRIGKLNQSRHSLEAYCLDCAGIAALAHAGRALCCLAEQEACKRQWGLGYMVGPGSTKGWPLEDQAKVCNLLDLEQINVVLDNQGGLSPLKTISGLIPMGPGYKRDTVGSTCCYCSQGKTCTMAFKNLKGKTQWV